MVIASNARDAVGLAIGLTDGEVIAASARLNVLAAQAKCSKVRRGLIVLLPGRTSQLAISKIGRCLWSSSSR